MPLLSETTLSLAELLLDPNNYRFQASEDFVRVRDERIPEPTVQARAELRLRDDSLRTLKASILSNGFVPIERLVVRALGDRRDGAR